MFDAATPAVAGALFGALLGTAAAGPFGAVVGGVVAAGFPEVVKVLDTFQHRAGKSVDRVMSHTAELTGMGPEEPEARSRGGRDSWVHSEIQTVSANGSVDEQWKVTEYGKRVFEYLSQASAVVEQ